MDYHHPAIEEIANAHMQRQQDELAMRIMQRQQDELGVRISKFIREIPGELVTAQMFMDALAALAAKANKHMGSLAGEYTEALDDARWKIECIHEAHK